MNLNVQRWLRFLQWFCPSVLYEGIESDLLEQYNEDVKHFGEHHARRKFALHVIRFFRPAILFRNQSLFYSINMNYLLNLFRSYLLIAFRNVVKHKAVSLINILGLSISMSVGILVLIIIKDSYSYDTFHPYPERTYRITTEVTDKEGNHYQYAPTPMPLSSSLSENYSFIEKSVRIYPGLQKRINEVVFGKNKIRVNGAFAEQSFFKVFGFQLENGDSKSALATPNTAVITHEAAQRIFGKDDPLGKTLYLNDLGEFTVTGVLQKQQQKSHLNFELYASMSSVNSLESNGKLDERLNQWGEYLDGYTYVVLAPQVDPESLNSAMQVMATQAMKTFHFKGTESTYTFKAQPLTKITPSGYLLSPGDGKSPQTLIILGLIGFIIVLLASFNYTNLTVARAFSRAKEVGVRKIAGAFRGHIFSQLIVESVVLSLIAFVIAFFLSRLIPLNSHGKQLFSDVSLDYSLFIWFFLFSVGVGILSGAFPAWILSRIKVLQALKNFSGTPLLRGIALRKILIVSQFSLSLVIIIFLLVIYQQSFFMSTADYGFATKDRIEIQLQGIDHDILSAQVAQHTQIEQVSAYSQNFGFGNRIALKKPGEDQSIPIEYYAVDQNFIPVFEIKLLAGSNISDKHRQAVLLNEKALEIFHLGSPASAIGKTLLANDTLVVVAGVIKDFHNHPFKHGIEPLLLCYHPEEFRNVMVKAKDVDQALLYVNKVWRGTKNESPLEYEIYEKSFSRQRFYGDDLAMIGTVAAFTILISCLGLLGIVMYDVEMRTKEIGIRKVMGANILGITFLLSRNFITLLLIAGSIALPAGYWTGHMFLNQFAYKIDMSPMILINGLLIMMLLGLAAIFSQTISAARSNPVDTLKYE